MYQLTNVDTCSLSRSRQEEVYVLDIQRTSAGLVSVGSDQRISVFDPRRLGSGPLATQRTDHGNLRTLSVFDASAAVVCTAGEHGTVSVWDWRLPVGKSQIAHFKASDAPILSMACDSSSNTIAVGTELHNHVASISLWDVRSTPSRRTQYAELHSDDITTLSFHPSTRALLLSGSTDGLVSVHDTRIADEDELTVQTFNHGASVHRAAFATPTEVLAVSHDERFALYDVAEERSDGGAAQDFGDLREGLGCQYVANMAPKTDGSGAVIGIGAQDRQEFELVFLAKGQPSWAFDKNNSVGLPGAHGEEIVRSFCFYDEENMVFTAGEDGKIKAWRSGS